MKFVVLAGILLVVGLLSMFGLVREDRLLGLPKFVSALIIAAIVVVAYLWLMSP